PLNEHIAHWPEDEPFHYETPVTKEMSGSVNIGKITTSTHTGTHIDAPFHFMNDGKRILDLDINRFIGPCIVLDIGEVDTIDREALKSGGITKTERLLITTAPPNDLHHFPAAVPGTTQGGAACMKEYGVLPVGVDVPLVDHITSRTFDGHLALYENDIYILET